MTIPIRHKLRTSETIISWVARLNRVSPAISEKQFLKRLFNAPKIRLHPYLPAHINTLASQTSLSAEELLTNHTLYPLFRSFGLDKGCRLKKAMQSDHGEKVTARAKLPHMKISFFSGIKFCPKCAKEDRKNLGFCFYRIQHQIPGVEACHNHGCLLQGIVGGDYGYDRHLPLAPKDSPSLKATDMQIEFGIFCLEILSISVKAKKPFDYRIAYRNALHEKELITPAGHIRMAKFLALMTDTYKNLQFGTVLGLPETLKNFAFVAPLVREKTHFPSHPTKHLLLAFALFDGDATKLTLTKKTKTHRNRKTKPKSLEVEAVVLKMLVDGFSMNLIHKITEKSQCYIKRIADLNSIEIDSNSQRFPDRKKRAILIKALSGQHRQSIADSFGVSIGYVEQSISGARGLVVWRKYLRRISSIKNAIQEIIIARKKHPNWLRKDIKIHCEKAFFSLYNYNKKLLNKLLPPKTKPVAPGKDWAKEDERICNEILTIKNDHKKSLSKLDYLVNGHGAILKRLNKLPKTKKLLNKYKPN